MVHDVLAVGLGPGVCACVTVVEPIAGAGGKKQVVWHVTACELQTIMQFVVVEVCAKRILPPADAAPAKPATATTANRTAKYRMSASTGLQSPSPL